MSTPYIRITLLDGTVITWNRYPNDGSSYYEHCLELISRLPKGIFKCGANAWPVFKVHEELIGQVLEDDKLPVYEVREVKSSVTI